MLRSASELILAGRAPSRRDRGKLRDLLFDAKTWRIRHAVVQTGRSSPELELLPPASLGRASDDGQGSAPPRPGLTEVDARRLSTVSEILRHAVHALDGRIGTVTDLVIDTKDWRVRYLVVDNGLLVSPLWLRAIDWTLESVHVDLAKAELERRQVFDRDRSYEVKAR